MDWMNLKETEENVNEKAEDWRQIEEMDEWDIFLGVSIDLEKEIGGESGIETQNVNPKESRMTDLNKTKETAGDKDNIRKEHAINEDDKIKNKNGNEEDWEHLEKHWEHAEKWNHASTITID